MLGTELEGAELPKRLEALVGASHDLVYPLEIVASQ
jgi:hypothetical protein